MDDIKSYLEKISNAVSELSIIDGSFFDMDVLKQKVCLEMGEARNGEGGGGGVGFVMGGWEIFKVSLAFPS